MGKKKFKDTTVGRILLGAAGIVSPPLAGVLRGVTSPEEAIQQITAAKIPTSEKEKLFALITESQQTEEKELTKRHMSDAMSDSWLSKNVRPYVLVWCIGIFSIAGLLDSVETIPFHINETWNDTFEKIMMSVVGFYFGGRTLEKGITAYKTLKL